MKDSREPSEATDRGAEVVLVCMPWHDLANPSLALSLLKALLARDGIAAAVEYPSLRFAEMIGPTTYLKLSTSPNAKMVCDWIFSAAAFDKNPDEPLPAVAGRPRIENYTHVRKKAIEHVDETARRILAGRPKIVGCTSTFQQHPASLALLRRIRELDPEVITMMGGANCETRMGRSTHTNFPWVDFVVSGDADHLIALLCRAVFEHGRALEAADLPDGILAPIHREIGYPAGPPGGDGVPRAIFQDMDSLPYPDFSDYFAALRSSPVGPAIDVGMVLETSRGCWWGAVSQCAFCGLNGIGIGFRGKSPKRALAEFEWLAERWKIRSVEMADNIFDMKYFDTVLPELARAEPPWKIFYETKANLKRSQVQAFREAGVRWLQPGIESLSTQVLDTMGKGAKSSTNVLLLKWSRELGIRSVWLFLWGFIGEEDAWYAETAELVPLLVHLQAPKGVRKIRYDRYSPHFNRQKEFGLRLVPTPMMAQIYPLPEEDLQDLAYFFVDSGEEIDNSEEEVPPERPGVRAVDQAVEEWREIFDSGQAKLTWEEVDDGLLITDTRPCAVSERRILNPLESAIYRACEEGPGPRRLAADLARRLSEPPSRETVESVIDELIRTRLMVRLDNRLISLAVRADAPDWPYSEVTFGIVDFEKAQLIETRLDLDYVLRLLPREATTT